MGRIKFNEISKDELYKIFYKLEKHNNIIKVKNQSIIDVREHAKYSNSFILTAKTATLIWDSFERDIKVKDQFIRSIFEVSYAKVYDFESKKFKRLHLDKLKKQISFMEEYPFLFYFEYVVIPKEKTEEIKDITFPVYKIYVSNAFSVDG